MAKPVPWNILSLLPQADDRCKQQAAINKSNRTGRACMMNEFKPASLLYLYRPPRDFGSTIDKPA